jgi:hypothetical protein
VGSIQEEGNSKVGSRLVLGKVVGGCNFVALIERV